MRSSAPRLRCWCEANKDCTHRCTGENDSTDTESDDFREHPPQRAIIGLEAETVGSSLSYVIVTEAWGDGERVSAHVRNDWRI